MFYLAALQRILTPSPYPYPPLIIIIGGDDMFYILENLRSFLNSQEIMSIIHDKTSSGLYLGRRFFPFRQLAFNSGGAGYLLDVKALKVLGANIDSPKCWPHQKGFWEDVNVGR